MFLLQDGKELFLIVEDLEAEAHGLELVFLGVVVEVGPVDAELAGCVADGDVAHAAGFGTLALDLLVLY